MSANSPTYPGVYIQELESPVHTIIGVSTSITAFIGRAISGPVNTPTTIHNFGDYSRIFGGLWDKSNMGYAVYHYFLNGGTEAIIIRVHRNARYANIEIVGSSPFLESANPGSWGNNLAITIDTDNVNEELLINDKTLFNLYVYLNDTIEETYLNLSCDPARPNFITKVLDESSNLVKVPKNAVILRQQPKKVTMKKAVPNSGSDGFFLKNSDIIDPNNPIDPSNPEQKRGVYSLDNVDLFNMLCIPPYDEDTHSTAGEVYTNALKYCYDRRAILIVDPPDVWKNKENAKNSIPDFEITQYHKNAAIFFPHIISVDPEQQNQRRRFVPCGAVAGVIARTDSQRGVWKAPAGIEASVVGASDLSVKLTDPENGELNPRGVNCLRALPSLGLVVWGSRTMRGADQID